MQYKSFMVVAVFFLGSSSSTYRDAELEVLQEKTKWRSVMHHNDSQDELNNNSKSLNNKLQVASYMIAHSCQEDESVST